MKITAAYYLSYPNAGPPDPDVAESELHVEVGGDDATIDAFEATYAFHVYSRGYLAKEIDRSGYFVAAGSLLVVERFDDVTIRQALEKILTRIADYGERKP